MEDFDSRWACPHCGSKDVEVELLDQQFDKAWGAGGQIA